tara:strand:- start:341 stop:694 length:354 start_codon:yes stop_codon:yes gene_type:complete
MKYNLIPISLIFGLFAGILFSIIDSAIFLFSEKELRNYMETHFPDLDDDEISIILGSISAAISIFIANYIDHQIHNKFKIMKNPLLDAIGIMIGVFIVIGTYELIYKKYIRDNKKNN